MDRKRVLILAGRFPPYDNPGVRRPTGLYKYLPEYGWEPWVITVDPEKGPNPYSYQPSDQAIVEDNRIIHTGFSMIFQAPRNIVNKIIAFALQGDKRSFPKPGMYTNDANLSTVQPKVRKRRIFQWIKDVGMAIRDLVGFPEPFFGWYPHALKATKRLYADVGFDAIISTSGPITSHLIASRLKQQYPEVVWIADYRDLWSQKVSREKSTLFQRLDGYLEKRTLRRADAITAVSTSFIHKLSQFGFSAPTQVIYNGYDAADYEHLSIQPVADKLVMTHAGAIYPGNRDPLPLLKVLAQLIAEGKMDKQNIEIRFFGYTADWLQAAVVDLELEDCVKIFDRIPRTQILAKLAESTILWTLDWEDADETGNIPAKVYEYMGCQRYIFASGGTENSEIAYLLNQTGVGMHVTNEQNELETALYKLYKKFQNENYRGFIITHDATVAYTHRKMAQDFGLLLDTVIR